MKVIHTSDWHLGAQLHECSRHEEHLAFLEWLKDLMRREQPDVLIVAGDVFDSGVPSNKAQALYYDFIAALFRDRLCRSLVVVGGNHDSPSLLDAPGTALVHLQTHVVGAVHYRDNGHGGYEPDCEKEVVVVKDARGNPGIVIGAVPYLRDADLRTSEVMESDADRTAKLKSGLQAHYARIAELAGNQRHHPDGSRLPLVLTGHLFLSGATTADEQSERDLRIGNLGSIEASLLPVADYYALGHLHNAQTVGGNNACRYSGAPIPMSFGEIRQDKSVAIIEFKGQGAPEVRLEPIPQTQRLAQLKGTPESVEEQLRGLVASGASVWVDVQVTEGDGELAPWWSKFSGLVEGTAVRLLRWQDKRGAGLASDLASVVSSQEKLEFLKPRTLFELRLNGENLTGDERRKYLELFDAVLQSSSEHDAGKE